MKGGKKGEGGEGRLNPPLTSKIPPPHPHREKADVEKRKSKHKDIQIIQSRQLEDTKQNLIQKLKDQHTEGKLIKQMVQDDIVAEQKTHLEKQSAARKQNEEMLKANMNLKVGERSERALRKARILAMNPAKWLQT